MFFQLCLLGFLTYFSYSLARFPVIPLYAQSLGIGPEALGFIVAASTITGVPGKFIFGGLSDIYGRRRLLILGSCGFALLPFTYFLAKGYWSLLLIRFIHGSATAIMAPVANATVADLAKSSDRGLKLGTFGSATKIGTTLGPWLCGILLSWKGFMFPFMISGIIGTIGLALALCLPKDLGSGRTAEPFSEFFTKIKTVISRPVILFSSVLEGLQDLGTGAIEAFMPIYAKTVLNLSDWKIGFLFGIQVAATLLTKPLTGAISDRIGRRPLIIGGLFLGGLAIILLPHQKGFIPLAIDVVFYGLAVALITIPNRALVTDLTEPKNYGAVQGVYGTIGDTGHALGPILAGFLVGAWGFQSAYAVFGLLLLGGAILFWVLVKPSPDAKRIA